jgi:hypothetical protein
VECLDARQRHGEHMSAAASKHTGIERLLEVMFSSVWSMPRLYTKDEWEKLVVSQSSASKDMSTELW